MQNLSEQYGSSSEKYGLILILLALAQYSQFGQKTNQCRHTFQVTGPIWDLACSLNGATLASSSLDCPIQL